MRKKITVLALAISLAASATACGSDEESAPPQYTGTDVGMIDPQQSDAGVIAQSAARLVMTWNPAEEASPWQVSAEGIEQNLGGKLAQRASNPTSKDAQADKPQQWDSWAQAKARVQAVADTPQITELGETTAKAKVRVMRELTYPDGSRSDLPEVTLTLTLKKDGDNWRATDLSGWP